MSGYRSHFIGADMENQVEEGSISDGSRMMRARDKAVTIISDDPNSMRDFSAECREMGMMQVAYSRVADFINEISCNIKGSLLVADIVIVELPYPSNADIDLLVGIDLDTKRTGAQLIISTTIDGVDAVYGCLSGNSAQILVAPTRADRMIALGEALARCSSGVRELSGDDRITLHRLSEQMSQIAQHIERISGLASAGHVRAFSFAVEPDPLVDASTRDRPIRAIRPALPDPKLVRKIIRNRQLRSNFFDGAIFADPAWDMLLDLTAARAEHVRVTVSSLCIASNVPSSTALRWIRQMTDMGLILREDDDGDKRRTFLSLSDGAALAMAKYFAELDVVKGRLI